jgi:Galactose-3-O-sulfotransferase
VLVFIHINKTAGRTVRYILRSTYGARHCEVEPWHAAWSGPPFSASDLRRLRKIYPRLESIAGHRITGHVDLDPERADLRYFTFLRDPVALCASRFQYHVDYRKKKDVVFDEWIEREWLRNAQTKQIGGTESVDDALRAIDEKGIFVGLTEEFDESLLLLKGLRAGDLDIAYRPVNVAPRNTLAAEVLASPRMRRAIVAANSSDLALYEHVTQELYPAQRRDYGVSLPEDVARYRANRLRDFNGRKLTASRAKQYLIYKPLLTLYRKTNGRATLGKASR